jgi:uncharacterized protein
MRFTQDSVSGIKLIRSYGGGEFRINDEVLRGSVIVSASTAACVPELRAMDDLASFDPQRLLELEPELILLGTGARQVFPAAAFGARFLRVGIGFEVMDTGAACRTFNVLVGEQRRVAALLMALSEGEKQQGV